VDEQNFILSGHCRVDVAKELGLLTVPTRTVTGWTAAQKRAYVIADNKVALLAEWDLPLLKSELEFLTDQAIDIEDTGFSTAEIDLMFIEPGTEDPDDLQVDAGPENPVSQMGDLWQLGEHRLLCGDALDAASYETVLGGEQAQMSISDVPYNVPINGHVGGGGKTKHREFAMASGEMSSAEFTAFLGKYFEHTHAALVDGAISFNFIDWRHVPELLAASAPKFGGPRQMCVWVKDNAGMGSFYRSQHELVYAFKKGSSPHINNFELGQHGRDRTNVWNYPGINSGKGRQLLALHPTVKPVALIADAIRDCSHRKGIVLDSFAGSGTILIAAERTGRRARAIELDPLYVDVAVQRWQRVTGRDAVLVATGQTWAEVAVERLQLIAQEVTP
jgi:hypothetical protein